MVLVRFCMSHETYLVEAWVTSMLYLSMLFALGYVSLVGAIALFAFISYLNIQTNICIAECHVTCDPIAHAARFYLGVVAFLPCMGIARFVSDWLN